MKEKQPISADELWSDMAHSVALWRDSLPKNRSRYHLELYKAAATLGLSHLVCRQRILLLKTDLWEEGIEAERDLLTPITSLAEQMHWRLYTVGVDVSHVVCAQAKKRLKKTIIVQCQLPHLPFQKHVFDLVLDMSTLDHLHSDEAQLALCEYQRVLRPGGWLVLIVYTFETHPLGALVRRVRWTSATPEQFSYQPQQVRTWLHNAGFNITRETSADIFHFCWELYPRIMERLSFLASWLLPVEQSGLLGFLKYLEGFHIFWAHTGGATHDRSKPNSLLE